MDTADARILEIVQRNNRMPAEKIARQVGLSASAVQRRLQRLRDTGVIEEDVAIVSAEKAGRTLTAIVAVTIGTKPSQRVFGQFQRLAAETPEVQQCYHVTGGGDFVLVIVAADMAEYEKLTRRLFVDNPDVSRFETSVVVKRVKFSTRVPIAPPTRDSPFSPM